MRTTVTNTVPYTESPPSPRSDIHVTTPGTSKSKFRLLFDWRKHSHDSYLSDVPSGADHSQLTPSASQQTSRPILGSRSRSDKTTSPNPDRSRSADNRLGRKRDRVVVDPPPLAQAYRQAILQAQLETPTSFTEKPSGRRSSHNSKDKLSTDVVDDRIEVKRSHKRTESRESTCSTQGKIFILTNGPHLLQYNGDSNGDALPEKILVLDKDSVAIACDAVPGRPWVLQVSKTHFPPAKAQGQTLRPSWSRLTLRQFEDRRIVNTLLLIFNDSEELYTWLFAARKEIENLGGLEYRPDADDDQTWRDNLTRTFATESTSESETQLTSKRSSTAKTKSTLASPQPHAKIRQEKPVLLRSRSTQSCTSSTKTSTSLDRFRDSLTSDGYSSTLATSCADGSAASASPIHDTFPSIKSVTDRNHGDLSLRSYTRNTESVPTQNRSPLAPRSLLERRKLSVNSLNLASSEEGKEPGRKFMFDLPSTISASPIDTPPSLTSPTSVGALSEAGITKESHEGAGSKPSGERSASRAEKGLSRKASKVESGGGNNKPKYSLFPVCPPSEIKDEPLASPSTLMPPSLPTSKSRLHPGYAEHRTSRRMAKHGKSSSRTVTLELRQHRVSALLGAGQFDQPQRSPAVTDEMIMSNFGVAKDDPPPSPMPEIRVPGLRDLKMDLDFLKTPYRAPSKSRGANTGHQRIPSARSVSSARSEGPTSPNNVPIGPPPSGPLPAVPADSRRSSRTNRSSQQSQRSASRRSEYGTGSEVSSHQRQASRSMPTAVLADKEEQMTRPKWPERRETSDSANTNPETNPEPKQKEDDQKRDRSRSRSRGRRRSTKNI